LGIYNTLHTKAECPFCGHVADVEVQFRYGDIWLHKYKIGDFVIWDRNNCGVPGAKKIMAEGIFGKCVSCKSYVDCDVVIERDQITEVHPLDHDRLDSDPGFRVIEL